MTAKRPTLRESLRERFLDPIDRLAEAIYAVLIVMTFTMAYRAIDVKAFEESTVSSALTRLAVAAFGCAFAWGIIDGAMYILLSMFERGETNRLLRSVRAAPTEDAAIEAIAGQLDDSLESIMPDNERREVYQLAYAHLRDNEPKPVGFKREDFFGAFGMLLIAILASLPLVLPLIVLRGMPLVALRASNLVAIAMLFFLGVSWARYSGSNPLKVGAALAGLGVGMVLVAIPLGG